jgi:DNA-directed RNA polymerase specialized sigma subunit
VDNVLAKLDLVSVDEVNYTDAEIEAIELELYGLTKEGSVGLKEKREREVQLLHDFRANPTPKTFEPLYNSFEPFIMSAAQKNMFGSPIPKAAHKALAAQSFYDSIRNWKPESGQFKTYMYNYVHNKGKRLNLTYQNFAYIPEARATKYQAYQNAVHILREDLGHEPSAQQIADDLALPIAEVERLQKEIRKSYLQDDAISMKGPSWAQSDKTVQIAHDFMHELIPAHQVVMEYALGMNGKPSLTKPSGGPDIKAICKASNLSEAQVRSAFKTISRKMKQHRGQGIRTDIEEIYGDASNG